MTPIVKQILIQIREIIKLLFNTANQLVLIHDSVPVVVSLIRIKTHFFTAAFVGDSLEHFKIHILNGFQNGTTDLSVLSSVGNHERWIGLPLYYKGATGDSDGACDSSSSVSLPVQLLQFQIFHLLQECMMLSWF